MEKYYFLSFILPWVWWKLRAMPYCISNAILHFNPGLLSQHTMPGCTYCNITLFLIFPFPSLFLIKFKCQPYSKNMAVENESKNKLSACIVSLRREVSLSFLSILTRMGWVHSRIIGGRLIRYDNIAGVEYF